MGMFDAIFGAAPAQPQGNPNGQPPQGQPATNQPPASGSPMIDAAANNQKADGNTNGATVPGEDATKASPLDEYKDLWSNPTDPNADPNKGKPQGYLGVDPASISGAVSKKDFSRVFDPAVMQKALGGDAQALGSLLNKAIQTALASSLSSFHTLAERGFDNYNKKSLESLPGEFKKFSLRESFADNPAMSHEAVAPVLGLIQQQFAQKFPDASAAELKAMATNYMKQMAVAMGGKFEDTQSGKTPEGRQNGAAAQPENSDWAKILDMQF